MVDEVAIGGYLPCMRSVGIKVLNSRLSEYVRLAASGETVLVTDRDRVVAELGPLRETRSPMLADAFLADAVRSQERDGADAEKGGSSRRRSRRRSRPTSTG